MKSCNKLEAGGLAAARHSLGGLVENVVAKRAEDDCDADELQPAKLVLEQDG